MKTAAAAAAPIHTRYPRGSFFLAMDNCEAAFNLSQESGSEPPTLQSDRGTDTHGVLSGKLESKSVDPVIVEEALELRGLHDRRIDLWREPFGGGLNFVRERRLWLRKGPKPLYSGQPDEYVVQNRRVYLSDYKTGWHPLDDWVATNAQIRAYVPLIDRDCNGQIDELTAGIHKPGHLAPEAIFLRPQIDDARSWAIDVVERATSAKEKKPNRGPWCKYCSGKVLCPLWKEEISSLSDYASAIVADIPDSALRSLAPKLEIARDVADKLLLRLRARVQARPEFFSDWRFVAQSPRRSVPDVIEAYNALVARAEVLSPADFLAACRIAVTELEKRIRKAKNLSVSGAQHLLADTLGSALESKPLAPTLVYNPLSLTDAAPNQPKP